MGEACRDVLRVGFDNRLRLQIHGAKICTEGGLFPYSELDEAARLAESGAGGPLPRESGPEMDGHRP